MAVVPICIYPTGYSLSGPELALYGATHRYTTTATMEAGEDIDWVTATDTPACDILGGDGSTNWTTVGADTTRAFFKGWTLSSTYFLTVKTIGSAIPDFNGIDTTAYRLQLDTNPFIIQNAADFYAHFEGLQIITTGGSDNISVIVSSGGAGAVDFKNCYIKNENEGTVQHDFQSTTGGAYTHRFWNCIFEESSDAIRSNTNSTIEIYHSLVTLSVSDAVYDIIGSSITIKNSVVFNNADDYLGTFTSIDYNASDDADGTNRVALNENASGEWTAAFTDYTSSDFSVKDASSLLYNAGTSLQGGSAPFTDLTGNADPMALDILGNSRTTNDIGPFVLVAAAGGTIMNQIQKNNLGADLYNGGIQ